MGGWEGWRLFRGDEESLEQWSAKAPEYGALAGLVLERRVTVETFEASWMAMGQDRLPSIRTVRPTNEDFKSHS